MRYNTATFMWSKEHIEMSLSWLSLSLYIYIYKWMCYYTTHFIWSKERFELFIVLTIYIYIYINVLEPISFYMIEGADLYFLVLTIYESVITHLILYYWRSRLTFLVLTRFVYMLLHISFCMIEEADWTVLVLTT